MGIGDRGEGVKGALASSRTEQEETMNEWSVFIHVICCCTTNHPQNAVASNNNLFSFIMVSVG